MTKSLYDKIQQGETTAGDAVHYTLEKWLLSFWWLLIGFIAAHVIGI